jgi:hypothetical protein
MRIANHQIKVDLPKQGSKAESVRAAIVEAVKKIPAEDLERFQAGQILIAR